MRKIISLAIFMLGAAFPAFAQDQAADLTGQSANVFGDGAALTSPSGASAADIVADFLTSEGFGDATLASLVQTAEIPGQRGVTHFRFAQEVDGLTVYGTYVRAAINADGQLIHLIENLADTAGGVRPAFVGPRAALNAALNRVHPGISVNLSERGRAGNAHSFGGDDFFWSDPTATRVAIVMNNGALREGFLVETWTDDDNQLNHTLVGGQGNVLGVQNRTNNDSYNIFPDHPGNSSQAATDGPAISDPVPSCPGSPIDWLCGSGQTTVDIAGNNVNAYLDTDANNSADAGESSVTDGNFLATANLSQEPETAQNKAVAVQNLFYLNNVLHDKLYSHGFVESAGNFQEDNFGNGGNENDSVNAEAQDGSGTNNANFATPSDGSNPRMQMFVWTQSTPKRDGDVDSDIVYHEYGHGLTWRMIGNMGGSMSGAIGEGMSDVLAILINDDDVLAEYSYNNPLGIRSARYTKYPRTYGDFSGNSVHRDGEIYAAAVWRLWEIFQANSITQDTLFNYIVDGMNDTPSGPSFEDMRDGILVAAFGSGDECLIWQAFADYGVGFGAEGTTKGGGPFGGGKVTITESFAMPPVVCGEAGPGNADPVIAANAGLTVANGAAGAITNSLLRATDTDNTDSGLILTISAVPGNGDLLLNGVPVPVDGTFTQDAIDNGDFSYQHDGSGTVTDSFDFGVSDGVGGSSGSATFDITIMQVGGGGTMHVGDLDGFGEITGQRQNKWTATVTVTVHDDADVAVAVANATVSGTWSNGAKGGGSCTTTGSGQCNIVKNGLKISVDFATFTVGDVTHATLTYSGANHDDDGDSDGTTIMVSHQ